MTPPPVLLEEDRTAVEQFAALHERGELPVALRTYESLVPATPPGPGQQYAFTVDLDSCTGCKSCVVACSSLNGLDEDESWRSVGLLRSGDAVSPLQQTVTTACHHCVEPACLQGCPVDAYEKDPITGIVAHLDDQCIGCGYCTWTCPYDVPRFSGSRGIVRKCDMCRGRLEAGEAPACVQACPTSAIGIDVVDVAQVRAVASPTATLVPGAPSSSRTLPTTVYLTKRPAVTELVAADRDTVRPAHAHPPLALMLVLTQLAVGAVTIDGVLRALVGDAALGRGTALLGASMGVLALGASIGHLGRPRYAFRAVLGFRHSWLSREVVALGLFGALALVAAASMWWTEGTLLPRALSAAAGTAGVVGVACSVMVYAVCGRRWWTLASTSRRFLLTTIAGGLAATLVAATATGASATIVRSLALASVAALACKLATDASILVRRRALDPELARTRALLRGELAGLTKLRFGLGAVGALALALVASSATTPGAWPTVLAVTGSLLLTAGELVERSLFFTAESGPRMPGPRP